MALHCSTLLCGQSNTGAFHTICEHNRTFVNNGENKAREDVSDSICSTDSNIVDYYCPLNIEILIPTH